ncbi:unnamed protein product [Dovyalis caffra]|uniref:Uncharacterized protein n=1 Tax=Dovyalis caffra TaxID=77055 RepID=A0AAV1RS55_9ROSI|nr:unnamed protein product [Dovyalis caffra]
MVPIIKPLALGKMNSIDPHITGLVANISTLKKEAFRSIFPYQVGPNTIPVWKTLKEKQIIKLTLASIKSHSPFSSSLLREFSKSYANAGLSFGYGILRGEEAFVEDSSRKEEKLFLTTQMGCNLILEDGGLKVTRTCCGYT